MRDLIGWTNFEIVQPIKKNTPLKLDFMRDCAVVQVVQPKPISREGY